MTAGGRAAPCCLPGCGSTDFHGLGAADTLSRYSDGSMSATFTIAHKPVAKVQTVMITARFGTSSRQATLTLQPAGLASISISPNSVKGSSSAAVTGTVTL